MDVAASYRSDEAIKRCDHVKRHVGNVLRMRTAHCRRTRDHHVRVTDRLHLSITQQLLHFITVGFTALLHFICAAVQIRRDTGLARSSFCLSVRHSMSADTGYSTPKSRSRKSQISLNVFFFKFKSNCRANYQFKKSQKVRVSLTLWLRSCKRTAAQYVSTARTHFFRLYLHLHLY